MNIEIPKTIETAWQRIDKLDEELQDELEGIHDDISEGASDSRHSHVRIEGMQLQQKKRDQLIDEQLSDMHDLIANLFLEIRRLKIHTGCDKKVPGLDDPAEGEK